MDRHRFSVSAARNRGRLLALVLACIAGCDTGDSPAGSSHSRSVPAEETAVSNGKTATDGQKKIGVLLVSHGSHSKNWREMLSNIGHAVRDEVLKCGRIAEIKTAFMEYTEPSIATQLKEFDRQGYSDVILVPLLLTVSSHSFDDIPTIIGQKQDHLTTETLRLEGIEVYRPKARVAIAPLLDFPAILGQNVIRRARRMSDDASQDGIVLVAYGSEEYDQQWTELLDEVGEEVRNATGVDCVEHAWCGHIVRYKSEPTETAIRSVLRQKSRALVIPVLVAVDETFQGRIIGGAIEKTGERERIVYRHDAILPDDNVNRWVVDISAKMASKLTGNSAVSSDDHQLRPL